MFSTRRFELFFLLSTSLIALFFLFRLTCGLYGYWSLRDQIPAKISQWELEEIGDRWAIRAIYSINVQGVYLKKATLFANDRFVNKEVAIRELELMAKKNWKAWYNPKNPSQSSLEKKFPFNLLIRT